MFRGEGRGTMGVEDTGAQVIDEAAPLGSGRDGIQITGGGISVDYREGAHFS